MAEYEIYPGNQRHRRLNYTKKDGSPGRVQDPPTWEFSGGGEELPAEDLATVTVDGDKMHGVVAHNGAIGDLTITSRADGDVGIGVHPIVITDIFHMKGPRDADGGTSDVSDEEAIAA